MKAYRDRSGDSGIEAYEYGEDWISLRFVHGGTYRYEKSGIGARALATLKRLADNGDGLNTYINQHPAVKDGWAERW